MPEPTKRYQAVKHALIEDVREGRWKQGERIPSEPSLARRFKVSVGTIRQAMGELAAEHVLVRQQGRGTFVATHTRDYLLNVFFPFVDRNDLKRLPESRMLDFRKVPATRDVALALALPARAQVYAVDHLMSFGGDPVIFDRILLPVARFAGLDRHRIEQRDGTFFGLYQQHFAVSVLKTVERLVAVAADARTAALLDIDLGSPVLKVSRVALSYRDAPVELRTRFVKTDDIAYLSVLGKR
ncbi:MAG: GntR family transcriptional regulator [Proteobacteria bacterium]|nr:GntR family transcriptional regulator [Burkholderiales bacterium]